MPVALLVGLLCMSPALSNGEATQTTAAPIGNVRSDAQWIVYRERNGLPGDSVRAIRVDGDEVWVGTEEGLARFDGTLWDRWGERDGLPCSYISAIEVDPETRDVWLGTWGCGLVRWTAGRGDAFDQFTSGLSGDVVFDVAFANGRVWVATNGGVSGFDPVGDVWTLHGARRADEVFRPVVELTATDGTMYAGAWRGGSARYPLLASEPRASARADVPSRLHATEGEPELSTNQVYAGAGQISRSTTEDVQAWAIRDGRAYFATPQVVGALALGSGAAVGGIRFPTDQPVTVHHLALRDNGEIWVSTDAGLFVLVSLSEARWLHVGSEGDGTGGCVTAYVNGQQSRRARGASILPSDQVHCVAFSGEDVWIGTSDGLAHGRGIPSAGRLWETIGAADHAGRDEPAAKDTVRTVEPTARSASSSAAVAIYGPRNSTISLPGSTQDAPRGSRPDTLAIDACLRSMSTPRSQASPPPTELVTLPSGYDRYLWGLPEDDLVYFRDRENVAAVLGSLSDRDLAAEAMLPRSGLAWMNTAALGPTTESGSDRSRWLFRCYGFEPALHRASMDYLVAQGGCPRLAVIYERGTPPLAVLWGRGYAKHRQWPEMLEIVLPDGATLAPSVASLAALRDANVCGVLLYVNNTRTASVVRAVRESGVDQPVMVWNARRSHDGFPEDETSLGPLILPVSAREADTASARRTQLSPPGDARPIDRLKHFVKEYTARGRREPPDEKAWRSFHAADHLFHAIGIAGADREAARSTLTAMRESPFGEEHYERLHGQPQCLFARFEDGRWHLETWPSVDDTTARLRQHEHGE